MNMKMILERFKSMHDMCRLAFSIGALTMLALYITAVFAYYIAPYVDFASARLVFHGCLEAAPASLASGVCAGVLGDIMLSRNSR